MSASRVPVFGVIIATLVGVLFLLPFPSWAKLVGIVTSASVFMYAGAPVALGALRRQKPDLPRTYRLPAAGILAPLAFAGAGWVILFSGWQTYSTLVVALLLGYALIWALLRVEAQPARPRDGLAGGAVDHRVDHRHGCDLLHQLIRRRAGSSAASGSSSTGSTRAATTRPISAPTARSIGRSSSRACSA